METTEYIEKREKPGRPEVFSWHWWQHPSRDGLYRACRCWAQVVRWRRSERSQGCPWPTHHVEDDEVWVEVDGVRTLVYRKYLPGGSTKPRDPLPAIAYPFLGVEQCAMDAAGGSVALASDIKRCLARQFVHGSGRVVTARDSKALWELMGDFVRLGQERFP